MLGANMVTKKTYTSDGKSVRIKKEEIGEVSPDTATYPPPPYYDLFLVTTEREIAKRGDEDDE